MIMRTAADEAASPKYAHIERERRWLVDAARRPDVDGLPHVRIEDRYLEDTRCRLRRMTASETGETCCKLTKKYEVADPMARPIVTAYLDADEYARFAALPASQLAKRRYPVEFDGRVWSLDRFEGPLVGLELAEIECGDEAGLRALAAPRWAVREVTGDPRYQGAALASRGLPKEGEEWRSS